jgi:hypothetical protein
MEISAVGAIGIGIMDCLAKDGLQGSVKIVDNHDDATFNDGQWIECKAVKATSGHQYQFVLMISLTSVSRMERSAFCKSFCAEAIHALGQIA